MNLYAVTGNPILHSKSPNIFNEIISKNKLEAVYFRLAADNAKEAISIFKSLQLKGMNVTAPFKTEIMELLDEIDVEAKKINAVNTIVNISGKLKGFNTDFIGVTESFKDQGIDLNKKKCVIIGAGGAGKASVYSMHKAGAEIIIIDIDEKTAQSVATEFGCLAKPYKELELHVRQSEIIVYAVDAALVEAVKEEWITKEHVIYDVNYKPSFLNDIVKNKGCKLITGAEMLINQAIPGYEYYFGTTPDKSIMWNGFHQQIADKKKKTIALIGFMGCGKTSVGKELAFKLNYTFIDLDVSIERYTGKTISEIFKTKGEEEFRKIEQIILKNEITKENVIVSCGGGIILNKENRTLLKENALTFWLYNSIETSVLRANDGTRPLLNTENPIGKAKNLFESRKEFYADAADMLVNTENKNIAEVTEKIYAEINKTFGNKR